MVADFTASYVDPGVIGPSEIVAPNGLNVNGQPFAPCLIGIADRTKRAANEAVQRGVVLAESLTVPANTGTGTSVSAPSSGIQTLTVASGLRFSQIGSQIRITGASNAGNNGIFTILNVLSGTQLTYANAGGASETSSFTWQILNHDALLANRGDRKTANTTLNRIVSGVSAPMSPLNFSYAAAFITGANAGPFNISSNNVIALEADTKTPIMIQMLPRTTLVAAAYGGATPFPGPVRSPSGSVTLTATVSGGFTSLGVTITVTGTNTSGGALVVTFPSIATANAGTTVLQVGGPQAFGSITSITFTGAIGGGGTISLGVNSDAASIRGAQITTGTNIAVLTAATRAEIANAINVALTNATSFGSSYASFASDITTGIRLLSPISSNLSDVRLFAAPNNDATATIFGTLPIDAATYLLVSDVIYLSSATWTANYINFSNSTDALANTPVQTVVKVGDFPNLSNYVQNTSWQLNVNSIDFSILTAGSVTSLAGNYALVDGTSDTLLLGLDSKALVSMDVVFAAGSAVSYNAPYNLVTGTGGAVTPAQIRDGINAYLAADGNYGPRYQSAAVVVGSTVVVTSPTVGEGGSVTLGIPTSQSGMALTFGNASQVTTIGKGRRPTKGSTYYVTYDYTRPTSDYNKPLQFFDADTARAQVGQVSASVVGFNPLAQAVDITFLNGAQSVFIVQVNDATTPGTPLSSEVQAAIDASGIVSGVTDVVVVDEPGTRSDIQVYLMNHVETFCGPIEKKWRRGWCGMSVNTAAGDPDTSGTFANRAARTLQPGPTSPARGRIFLVSPPQASGISRILILADGSVVRRTIDSTYLAVAVAAKRTGLTPPSTLTRRTLVGFNVDDISAPWKRQERWSMAGSGVLVITFDNSRLIMLDALSTEGGGGGLTAFKVDSTSTQKDNLNKKLNQALDSNIIAVVPFSLVDFILDVKLVIANVISGEIAAGTIGPYLTDSGATRPIDIRTDIRVSQAPSDPTKYFYTYTFNLRYPALRLIGEFVVNAPIPSSSP